MPYFWTSGLWKVIFISLTTCLSFSKLLILCKNSGFSDCALPWGTPFYMCHLIPFWRWRLTLCLDAHVKGTVCPMPPMQHRLINGFSWDEEGCHPINLSGWIVTIEHEYIKSTPGKNRPKNLIETPNQRKARSPSCEPHNTDPWGGDESSDLSSDPRTQRELLTVSGTSALLRPTVDNPTLIASSHPPVHLSEQAAWPSPCSAVWTHFCPWPNFTLLTQTPAPEASSRQPAAAALASSATKSGSLS